MRFAGHYSGLAFGLSDACTSDDRPRNMSSYGLADGRYSDLPTVPTVSNEFPTESAEIVWFTWSVSDQAGPNSGNPRAVANCP
jgi:hypothetical protein